MIIANTYFIATLLFSMITLGNGAYGLVNQVQAWKSPETGQRLVINGSIHNLGDEKENKDQMKYFISNLLISCEKSNEPIEVLFEGDLLYYLGEIDGNKLRALSGAVEELFPNGNSVNSAIFGKEPLEFFALESDNNFDWIQDELIKILLKDKVRLKNISFESIDPRMPLHLWADSRGLKYTSFKDLVTMGKYNQEISDLLGDSSAKYDALRQVLSELKYNVDKDVKNIFAQLNKEEKFLVEKYNNLEIAKKGHHSLLKKFASLLIGDRFVMTPKFASKLDEEAVWKIANPQAKKKIVLLIGSSHLKTINNYLVRLGYKKEFDIKGAEESTLKKNPTETQTFLAPSPTKINEAIVKSRNFLECGNK